MIDGGGRIKCCGRHVVKLWLYYCIIMSRSLKEGAKCAVSSLNSVGQRKKVQML